MLIPTGASCAHPGAGKLVRPRGRLLRVLLVDDDIHIRKLLRTALRLESDDLELQEAENGTDAVRLARDFNPGVIEKKPDWADAHYVKGQLPDLERIIHLDD